MTGGYIKADMQHLFIFTFFQQFLGRRGSLHFPPKSSFSPVRLHNPPLRPLLQSVPMKRKTSMQRISFPTSSIDCVILTTPHRSTSHRAHLIRSSNTSGLKPIRLHPLLLKWSGNNRNHQEPRLFVWQAGTDWSPCLDYILNRIEITEELWFTVHWLQSNSRHNSDFNFKILLQQQKEKSHYIEFQINILAILYVYTNEEFVLLYRISW